jgi:hypothetical protein
LSIGGRVIQQSQVLPLVRQKVQSFLKGYIQSVVLTQEIDDYIVLPGLDNRSGVLGAIALAEQIFLNVKTKEPTPSPDNLLPWQALFTC